MGICCRFGDECLLRSIPIPIPIPSESIFQYQYQYQYLGNWDFQYQYQYQYRPKNQYLNTNTRYCLCLVSTTITIFSRSCNYHIFRTNLPKHALLLWHERYSFINVVLFKIHRLFTLMHENSVNSYLKSLYDFCLDYTACNFQRMKMDGFSCQKAQ